MTEYITTKEAARLSGYSTAHIALLLRTMRVKGQRFGRLWMVSKRSLDEYIAQTRHEMDGRYGPRQRGVSF